MAGPRLPRRVAGADDAGTLVRERRLLRRWRREQRGVAAVELALVMPILLLVVFGIIDFGITFGNYENVRSGTREAAGLASSTT